VDVARAGSQRYYLEVSRAGTFVVGAIMLGLVTFANPVNGNLRFLLDL
jgi:hypothetical protein